MAANSHLTRLSFGGFNLVKITTNEMERKVTLVCNTLVLSGRYKRLGLESAVRTGVSRLGQTNPSVSVFPSTNHKRWTPLTSRDPNSLFPAPRNVCLSRRTQWTKCPQRHHFGCSLRSLRLSSTTEALRETPHAQRMLLSRHSALHTGFRVFNR
jgi:hypothetical protein